MKLKVEAREPIALIKRLLKNAAALVEHNSVLSHVSADVEMSASYFIALVAANLIALLGLLTNSSPVIIGAMLISPLMGPILSAGAMFATGDASLWRRSIRKIFISVVLTVAVAAVASFISPLKDITVEIAARTRPNLYDLLIAFLAGGVGASAICTKRSYLTIVPGVAIATAVIPPLSVCGFGLGVLNFPIFIGGFFLFFTNFVAILIVTALVFLIYGFRPGIGSEADLATIKRKVMAMALALCLVSIPLVYTLYSSVKIVRLRGEINKELKIEFDREGRSHLAGFSFKEGDGDQLDVNITLNTRSYLLEKEIVEVEERLKKTFDRPVRLNAEQVLVQSGGLKTEPSANTSPLMQAGKAIRSQADILRGAREELLQAIRPSRQRLDRILAPYKISSLGVGFDDAGISITLQLRRSEPFEEEKRLMLERILSEEFGQKIGLKLEYLPIVEPLVFKVGEVVVTPAMRLTIAFALKDIIKSGQIGRLTIESYAGKLEPSKSGRRDAITRARAFRHYLAMELGVASDSITVASVRKGDSRSPLVALKILRDSQQR